MRVIVLIAALAFSAGTIASENDGSGNDKAFKPVASSPWNAAFFGFVCRYFGFKCAPKGETPWTIKSENDGSGN